MTPPRLIAILGMHRSGTSCLAGSLEQRGLNLGPVFEWSPHNLKGNRENAEVMLLNEAVLEASGGSWDLPPELVVWTAEQARERNRIIDSRTETGSTTWGFKDPRTVITLPFWQAAEVNLTLVGSFRHPILAARSLKARNGMSLPVALGLWKAYNARLLVRFEQEPFPLISFDLAADEYLAAVDRAALHLHLPQTSTPAGDHFIDDGLRHRDLDGALDLVPSDVTELYGRLLTASRMQFPRA